MATKKTTTSSKPTTTTSTTKSAYAQAESGYKPTNTVNKYTTSNDMINSWNTSIDNSLTQKNGNYYNSKGTQVYVGTDNTGAKHYSTDSTKLQGILDGYNSLGSNATYSLNGVNYTVAPEEQKQFSIDTSGVMSQAESYARDLERIKSYYDAYLPAMQTAGKAAADKEYESNTNAAYNTWLGSTSDLKQNYNTNTNSKRDEIAQARQNYISSMNNVGSNNFSQIQQGRENASARGLSNSGLMQAIDQNAISSANQQRAEIDSQYNAQIAKLNSEISTLVENYGIGKKEADEIYNTTVQSLEKQRQAEYEKVINESQQKAIEYQFGVDSFNANAWNSASSQLADIAKDVWTTKVNNETQLTIAQLQADTQMSVAQLQDATDRWIANQDNETKKWVTSFDRDTQIIISKLNAETQKELANISGQWGLKSAATAAQIAYTMDRNNLKTAQCMETFYNAGKDLNLTPEQSEQINDCINRGDSVTLTSLLNEIKSGTNGKTVDYNAFYGMLQNPIIPKAQTTSSSNSNTGSAR